MSAECTRPVTMISDRGYVYCRAHGALAKSGGAKARKLRPWELKLVEAGEQVPSYRFGPKPVEGGLKIETTAHVMAAVGGLTGEPVQVVIINGTKGVSVSVKKGEHPSTHVSFAPAQARELAAQLIARAAYIEKEGTK